jgi:hypothetical protein
MAAMATKPKTKKTDFEGFARMMSKAVKMGRDHKVARQAQATPLELAVELKVPGAEARSIYVLYLRESYLAGYNFKESD